MEKVLRTRLVLFVLAILVYRASSLWELEVREDDSQPLSKIALHRSTQKLDESITITANPVLLGQKVHHSHLHLSNVPPKFSVNTMVLRNKPFGVDRGKQQNMLLSSTRSPLVQVKQTGLEYSHLQNSSMFLSLFGL